MKIIFFGSSSYCLPIVESLSKNFTLTATITKSDSSPQSFALSKYAKVFTPKNTQELMGLKEKITKLNPDLAIVADYGMIIPPDIFNIPKYKTLNIHFSKLPLFRGPSPVQYTILMGEKSAWISVIIMDKDMDTGDIIWQKELRLHGDETSESLYINLFNIAAMAFSDIIKKYINRDLKPQKQIHSHATYTKHLTREDGFIPWEILKCALENSKPSMEAFHSWPLIKIIPKLEIGNWKLEITYALRAFTPWPSLWTIVNLPSPKRLKILKTHLELSASQGETLQGYRLVIDIVQLEGKNPVSWKQFTEGHNNYSFL